MTTSLEELIHQCRLLRRINNGRGPVQILMCVFCLRSADIREDEHAWDSWIITPFDQCPACVEAGQAPGEVEPVHLVAAREIFKASLRKVLHDK